MHHGETVKRHLRDNDWRQEDFAQMLGVTRQYLGTLFKGIIYITNPNG